MRMIFIAAVFICTSLFLSGILAAEELILEEEITIKSSTYGEAGERFVVMSTSTKFDRKFYRNIRTETRKYVNDKGLYEIRTKRYWSPSGISGYGKSISTPIAIPQSWYFEGVGIELDDIEKGKIIDMYEGSPAIEEGLQVGDKIIEIDGGEIDSLSFPEIIVALRGKAGSKAVVKYISKETGKTSKVKLTRRQFSNPKSVLVNDK